MHAFASLFSLAVSGTVLFPDDFKGGVLERVSVEWGPNRTDQARLLSLKTTVARTKAHAQKTGSPSLKLRRPKRDYLR